MKNIKRLLGLILAMVLLIGCLPISAFAQEVSSTELSEIASGTCGDNAMWTVYSDKSLVISGTGAVTSAPWKDGYSTAYSLIIQEGITKLCSHAFRDMPKLSSVQLPLSLTEISSYCFTSDTSLKTIDIPNSVTKIGEFAFGNTGFTTFTIPDSVTSDVHDIVSGSNLIELYIGAGARINENNWNDFNKVPNLQNYVVSVDNPYYASQDGVLYTKDMKTLVKYPDGRPGTLSIPRGVEVIARYAFYYADKITEINIPDSVTTIGNGNLSLYEAKMLQNINVDNNNEYFSSYDGVLYNKARTKVLRCGLGKQGSVELHPNIWEIGASAFSNCAEITAVSIPNGVEAIGSSAFSGCTRLDKIVIPSSVIEWGQFCFMNCDSLQWIACGVKNCRFYQDFDGCYSLKDVYYYGTEADWNTITISSFDTPAKNAKKHFNAALPGTWPIEYILNGGTNNNDNPSNYYNYGNDVTLSAPNRNGYNFDGWYLDQELTEEASAPQLARGYSSGEKIFYAKWSADTETHVHQFNSNYLCECGAIGGTCGENLTWALDEEGTLTISGIGDIEEQPWSTYRSSVKSLIVEEGINGIGVSAFANCINLDNVVLPDSITYIDISAFHSCVNLNSISIPTSVTFIDPDAFAGCDNLSGIWVDKDNAQYTNDSYGVLFNKDMTRLVKYPEGLSGTYTIPNGVTTVGMDAFMGSQNLTGIIFSDTVTELSSSAFIGCSALKNVTIPGTITKIDSMAFAYCSALESIKFEGNAPSLNDIAFAETTTTVYYPANNPTWTDVIGQDYAGSITWVSYGETTEEPDINGYSAGLSTTTPTTTTGEKVYISVAVNHEEETTFNAGELVFTYDSTRLSFNQNDSTLGNATVKAANGTLVLEDYGAAKNCGNGIYTLVFDAIADGNITVKLTSAAFSNQENAAASDLIAGVAYPDSVNIAISKKNFAVTLPDGMTGASTATDGNSYTFRISDQNYTYSNVAATVDGKSVFVTDNGDGSYTINSVSGVLKITATRTPKSYEVRFTGTAAADITGAAATATYGTDYKFTIPAASGWAYSLSGITIGGNGYTGYSAEGSEYTIPGASITGEIVITVNKVQTTASVTVTGSGVGAAAGYDATAEIGESYTLTITPENGYNYTVTATMGGKPVELTQDGNKYTIAEVTGNIVFTIERTVIVSGVTVTEYVSVDGNKVWLIQNTITLAEGKVPTYNGGNMFWSEKYDAYCYLVIATTLSEEDAKAAIGIADGSAVAVDYGMDVNMTGNMDANDAQLTYNIYNAYYNAFDETATVEKFLRADVITDGKINTTDSAAIINKILNG